MTFNNILRLLVTVFVSAAMTTGCTRDNGAGKVKNERNELSAKQQKLKSEQESLAKLQAEYEASQKDLQAKIESLNGEKATWDGDREKRELELTELSRTIQEKTESIATMEADLKKLTEAAEAEKTKIAAESEALKAEKNAIETELAAKKAAFASADGDLQNEMRAKITETEARLTENTEKQKALEVREAALKEMEAKLLQSEATQKRLSEELVAKQASFDDLVKKTRELFSKEGLGDILDAVEAGKKLPFLVTIAGRGSKSYIEKYRNELKALNQDSAKHYRFSDMGKAQFKGAKGQAIDSYFIDDQLIINNTVDVVRKFRDEGYQFMTAENNRGVGNGQTQLFFVVRPIRDVRFGMNLVATGSKAIGYQDRRSDEILNLKQVRPSNAKILAIGSVDLSNPSTYVFANDVDARKCDKMDLECIKMLIKLGYLDAQYSLTQGVTRNGPTVINVSAKETLNETLIASIAQMRADYDIWGKKMMLAGIGYSTEDNVEMSVENESLRKMIDIRLGNGAVKKLAGLLFGLGEERAAIVDSVSLSYRVTMIDYINSTSNHLDTWKYLSVGFVQNVPLFDLGAIVQEQADRTENLAVSKVAQSVTGRQGSYELGHSRTEIEIQLPINNLKVVKTSYADLNMADFKNTAVAPVELDLDKMRKEGKTTAQINQAKDAHNKSVDKYKKTVFVTKDRLFKNRLFQNAGEQQILVNELSAK